MDTEHYKINQFFMSWIGQWPEQSLCNKLFFSFNLIFSFSSQLCLQICGLVAAWQDWDLFIECATPIFIYIGFFIKFLNCLFNTYKIKSLLIQMRDNWNLMTFDTQIKILTAYTIEGKKLTKTYAIIMYSSAFAYIILPVTPSIVAYFTNANQTQVHGLLYHVETVLDVERYYYFILFHSYYTTMLLITIPVAADSMLIICVQHACGLFKAIGYQLENMKHNDNININVCPLRKDDEHYRAICDSVVKHSKVLQFAELLGSTYSISLFIITILNVAIITFSGVQTVINMDRPLEALRFAVAGICIMMHFLFLSIPGQKLIDHSTNIHQSICAIKWYAISVRVRKLLILMLMRCKIPCQVKAGKMYVMSLQNFNRIIQASMSYFTILTSMR